MQTNNTAMRIPAGENADIFDAQRIFAKFCNGKVITSLNNTETQQTYKVLTRPEVHGPEYGFIVGNTNDEWDVHAALSAYTTSDKKRVMVGVIYVTPKYRNLGYGRTLLEQARKYIPAAKLLTSSDNIGSMAVRNWCSVARRHKEIHLIDSDWKKVNADFSGPVPIITKGSNKIRMDQGTDDYFFVWPK